MRRKGQKGKFQEELEIINEIDILSSSEIDVSDSFDIEENLIEDFENFEGGDEVGECCSICGSAFHDEDVHWASGHGLSRKKTIYYDDEDDWIEYILKKRGW